MALLSKLNDADPERNYLGVGNQYTKRIDDIEYREIISCRWDLPVWQAAQLMAKERVSCLFITGNSGHIDGFVTDIVLRDRVIAQRADLDKAVVYFMDRKIQKISSEAYVYEALLMMFRTKSRYLLICEEDHYTGFLSRNKLLGEQAESPLVFIQSVKSARSVQSLKTKWAKAPHIVHQLISRGINAEIVNQVITSIADTIAQNIIEEVLQEKGPAPARFVFMVLGSEGRKEQTLKTDQDNAIIYEDTEADKRHDVRNWFLDFASEVSDKLNAVGFHYCSGGFMASNPTWTHSLSHWKDNYRKWMEEALPETAIKFSTFFDCRLLFGDRQLMMALREYMDEALQQPLEKFFVYLTKNALQYTPPIAFFRPFKTIIVNEKEVFDSKKIMSCVVDLVRVYALRNRVFKQNTGERLMVLRDMGVFSDLQYKELSESYYFLMALRLRHQAGQLLVEGGEASNYIEIKNLSKIEVVSLKTIFKSIEAFQTGIRIKFTNSLLN